MSGSDSFCILPWIHFYANEIGQVYPCCISTDESLPNIDENGRPYSLKDPQNIYKAWNSNYMKDIRLKMLKNERPAPCGRCYKFEDAGISSHRQSANLMYGKYKEGVLSKTQSDGSAEFFLRTADIRLGNVCNLRCRMCSPMSSITLLKEWQQLHGNTKATQDYSNNVKNIDWFEKDEFWNLMEKFIPDLETLHFAGGEPLIIKKGLDFLKKVIDSGHAHKIAVTYNTNLSVLPKEVFELWPKFREVRLMISIDGYKELNHYIRYPSKWSDLDKNLRTVDQNARELKLSYLSYNTTIQMYNILNIVDFLEYTTTQFKNIRAFPLLSLLFHPDPLSIQVLPYKLKVKAAKRLLSFMEKNASSWPAKSKHHGEHIKFIENIHGVIKFMMEKDTSHLLPEFIRMTSVFDSNRKHHLLDYVPDLEPIFKDEKMKSFVIDKLQNQHILNPTSSTLT